MRTLCSLITTGQFVLLLCLTHASAVSDGDLRLVGGTGLHDGLVEIYHNGTWGSICANSWSYHQVSSALPVCYVYL